MRCSSCGELNPDSNNFCGECGARLAPQSGTAVAPRDAAERRHLTVMFCDLVDSTPLSRRLDPEKLRDVIRIYRDRCAQIISANKGTVARYAGDGICAYFGYPKANEDAADRAIQAALEIIQLVPQIEIPEQALQVRLGIATGLVVVGDLVGKDAKEELAVVGEAPNLAARLQSLAEPGNVVISHGTRLLAGELFEYADLGEKEIKGFAAAQRVWCVLRRQHVESRFEALQGFRLTP